MAELYEFEFTNNRIRIQIAIRANGIFAVVVRNRCYYPFFIFVRK